MTLTISIAIWGAVTGTLGLVLNWIGRRDRTWARRAKVTDLARPALQELKQVLISAQQNPQGVSAASYRNRAETTQIGEFAERSADKQLARHLKDVVANYQAAVAQAAPKGPVSAEQVSATGKALAAIERAEGRMNLIDRKSS